LRKDGKLNKEMPWTLIKLEFIEKNGKTVVKTSAKYPNPEDLKKVIDMGLIAGMTETLELDEYLVKLK
jgi:hypothetical protein